MTANTFILITILMAFVFDFINGFHDAANSIATIVSTGVLTPVQAVVWAAFFNFIAFLVFNLMVANTIGNGLIDTSIVDTPLIFSALTGAIFWNLVTWYYGLPSSSSHALVGGLVGAALVKAGVGSLVFAGLYKVMSGIVVAPLAGLMMGFLLMSCARRVVRNKNPQRVERVAKGFQLVSSALLSLTHGGNDAQKTMGIISVLLFSASWLGDTFYVPFWVVISCHLVISLGTLAGGWRIVHVMGHKITQLEPVSGCAAETGAAMIIFIATETGVPVSTTHTVTGSITGVGLTRGFGAIHGKMIVRIVSAWMVTVPAAGMVSAALMMVFCGQ